MGDGDEIGFHIDGKEANGGMVRVHDNSPPAGFDVKGSVAEQSQSHGPSLERPRTR